MDDFASIDAAYTAMARKKELDTPATIALENKMAELGYEPRRKAGTDEYYFWPVGTPWETTKLGRVPTEGEKEAN